ncbi:DUF1735 domain-containing protein [Niastella caeni]|uniref:DUF1735 domain-containing protein n=1 Tax=Niastella caeni TaxID=2569763 RepID=A0A4S8HP10_9BACT|nr:DUF1735 domain-containing protein [Niastella caeni]THU37033.1 DUF1735 domain-containing protein [Niastella caeni]
MKYIIPFALIFLSACLKNEVTLDYSGIKPVIVIPNANWPVKGYAPQLTDSVAGITRLNVYARVSHEKPLDKDVRVKFVIDNAQAEQYNNQWGADYRLLPANCYQANAMEITIPAGTQQVLLPVTIIPGNMDPQYNYILPVSIASADGYTVGANFKTMIFTLKGR